MYMGFEGLIQPAESMAEGARTHTFEEAMRLSPLYTYYNLIDEDFLSSGRKDERTKSFLKYLSEILSTTDEPLDRQILDLGVLTSQDFIERVTTAPHRIHATSLAVLLAPTKRLKEALPDLITKGYLTSGTLWNKFLRYENFYAEATCQPDFDWQFFINSGIVRVDQIETETDGFDAVETDALKADLLGKSKKSDTYPIDKKAHPLVLKLRGQENTQMMSRQIERVPGLGRSPLEDLDTVFKFYLLKTRLYAEIARRDLQSHQERLDKRKRNIELVNQQQRKRLKKSFPTKSWDSADASKRHFDIYARYNHGQMDPLQLAFIAKTAEWYIMGGRSLLFNSVRITPYKWQHDKTSIPWIAHKACAGSEMNMVAYEEFRDSHLYANRTFLTHSDANESVAMGSIPIIGLATHANTTKRPNDPGEYVLFNADFDPKDFGRGGKKPRGGVNGNIAGLINESLYVMLEVEKKEIARAEAEVAAEEEAAQAREER
jgi:hypothetical protein